MVEVNLVKMRFAPKWQENGVSVRFYCLMEKWVEMDEKKTEDKMKNEESFIWQKWRQRLEFDRTFDDEAETETENK